jgi:hypothetical protein
MDNMGGIRYETTPSNISDTNGGHPTSTTLVSKWNMAQYLPAGVDEFFRILINQFIKRRAEVLFRYLFR